MFETVLVAVDGSEPSHRAVLAAEELAALAGGRLHLLHVQEVLKGPPGALGGNDLELEPDEETERILQGELGALERGCRVSTESRKGSSSEVARIVMDVATAEGADIIVMGSRGHSSLGALLIGSNAYKAIHLADRPVLVVR